MVLPPYVAAQPICQHRNRREPRLHLHQVWKVEAMTTPTEQSIRKACEEAGVPYVLYNLALSSPVNTAFRQTLLALARRIEAEREAVPVVTGDSGLKDPVRPFENTVIKTVVAAYAAPPKEPTT